MSPQQRKLLNALQVAGKHGIHSSHVRTQLHIGDPSRRVGDLEDLGYKIHHQPERRGDANGVRYFLRSSKPERGSYGASPSPPALSSGGSHLSNRSEPVAGAPAPARKGAPAKLEVVLDCTGPRTREYVRPEESFDDWEQLAEFPDGLSLWKPKTSGGVDRQTGRVGERSRKERVGLGVDAAGPALGEDVAA